MRDYDFGNRLAELRKVHGYSQYQLGTLVGVSDKAVSKWENGAAKPRISVVMKLAAVLGVDMEEILTDDREAYQKDGEVLAEKKRELWLKAESRMKDVYGETPDLAIRNRFLMEKHALNMSDTIVLFETMRMLNTYANNMYGVFTPRALTACSFIAWLLGASAINPLPAHYRCPVCHRTEFRQGYKSGWDLPVRNCETCGSDMRGDGHDLPFEICACGTGSSLIAMDCNLSENLIDNGWKLVLKHLSPFYSFMRFECCKDSECKGARSTRIFLLPKKRTYAEDIDSIPAMGDESIKDYLGNIPSLFLLPVAGQKKRNGEFYRNLIRPELMTAALLNHLAEQRKAYEEFAKEMGGASIRIPKFPLPEKTGEIKTFSQFVDVLCAVKGTYTEDGPESLAASLGADDYLNLPLSREDIWHLVFSASGLGSQAAGIAGEIVYKTRKGLYSRSLTDDDRRLFEQLNLPPWFADFVQKIKYLFPRSHCVSTAYQMLLML